MNYTYRIRINELDLKLLQQTAHNWRNFLRADMPKLDWQGARHGFAQYAKQYVSVDKNLNAAGAYDDSAIAEAACRVLPGPENDRRAIALVASFTASMLPTLGFP
jgi:hypothetical protein